MNKQAAQTEIDRCLDEAAHIAFPLKPSPVRRLSCADWVLNRRPFGHDPMTLEEFERTYGKRGYHFAIERQP